MKIQPRNGVYLFSCLTYTSEVLGHVCFHISCPGMPKYNPPKGSVHQGLMWGQLAWNKQNPNYNVIQNLTKLLMTFYKDRLISRISHEYSLLWFSPFDNRAVLVSWLRLSPVTKNYIYHQTPSRNLWCPSTQEMDVGFYILVRDLRNAMLCGGINLLKGAKKIIKSI